MNDHSAPGAPWNNLPRGANAAPADVAGASPELAREAARAPAGVAARSARRAL
ncbi:hypothetical protein [Sorangium sp. So ce1099]|uniref:hypothetical protein n=1 Tax=Sorangium sp. So ce1099 TaxID=3133331 RepID=UPI003F6289AD